MRKSKLVIGAAVAVAASFAMASVARAAITNQLIATSPDSVQQAKTPGGVSLHVDIKTMYGAQTPAATNAAHNDLDLTKDGSVNPPKGQCNGASLAGTNTAGADAICGAELVGQGTATLCSPLSLSCATTMGGGGPTAIPATIHAYNGVPQGGNPTLVLHVKPGGLGAATPPTILTGIIGTSPLGGLYGKRLATDVPDTSGTGVDLTDFDTTINKLVTVKANKKKHKPAKYYLMAKCTTGSWAFQETNQYRNGGGSATATATQACTKKKAKKKK
jgi:hypothetical protein